jgi:hypothetical protein
MIKIKLIKELEFGSYFLRKEKIWCKTNLGSILVGEVVSLFHRFRLSSEMIIFESILTTILASIISRGRYGSGKIGSYLKLSHHKQI